MSSAISATPSHSRSVHPLAARLSRLPRADGQQAQSQEQEIREPNALVHSVAVSLEDLPGAVTITLVLVRAGLLPTDACLGRFPSMTCAPSARWSSVRRSSPYVYAGEPTPRFGAIDELDLFLAFYDNGLYVRPDPKQVAQALPRFRLPGVAATRRRRAKRAKTLALRAERLDSWYLRHLGLAKDPVPKPTLAAALRSWRSSTRSVRWPRPAGFP